MVVQHIEWLTCNIARSFVLADKGDTSKKDSSSTDQPQSPQDGGEGSNGEDKGTGGSSGGENILKKCISCERLPNRTSPLWQVLSEFSRARFAVIAKKSTKKVVHPSKWSLNLSLWPCLFAWRESSQAQIETMIGNLKWIMQSVPPSCTLCCCQIWSRSQNPSLSDSAGRLQWEYRKLSPSDNKFATLLRVISADKGDTKKKDPKITDQPKSPQKGGQGSSAEDKGTGAGGSTGGD